MLEIDVVTEEDYDEAAAEFRKSASVRVNLEHSLHSLSKWESFWEVAFLGAEDKTNEQTVSYVQMMIVGELPPPEVFRRLLQNHLPEIQTYIGAKMTATTLPESKQSGKPEKITAELIYYWMVSMQIPIELEHWHLNRLITLVRVIAIKNAPKTKQQKMTMAQRRALNNSRLAKYNTRG